MFASDITGGLFWQFVLVAIFIITYLALKDWPTPQASASAGWITFLTALMLWLANLVPDYAFFLSVAVMIGTTALLFARDRD